MKKELTKEQIEARAGFCFGLPIYLFLFIVFDFPKILLRLIFNNKFDVLSDVFIFLQKAVPFCIVLVLTAIISYFLGKKIYCLLLKDEEKQ